MSAHTAAEGCCNVRVLSYIVASIHIVVSFLIMILLTAVMFIYHRIDVQADKSDDSFTSIPLRNFIIAFIVSVVFFSVTVIMMRGIRVHKAMLILPFVFWNAITIIVSLVAAIIEFIISLVHKEQFGTVVMHFVGEFIFVVTIFVLLVPVVLLYKNLRGRPYSHPVRSAETEG